MKYLIIILIIIFCLLKFTKAQSWQSQSSGTTVGITSIYFTDANTGWALGWKFFPSKVLLKTTNAGATWFSQTLPASVVSPCDIWMVNSTTGYIVTHAAQIYKTTDGGSSWFLQLLDPSGEGNFNSIIFTNTNTGYAVGYPGLIYKTVNAGSSWLQQITGTSVFLYDIAFSGTDTAYVSGDNGTILKTVNGGAGWIQSAISGSPQLTTITFINSNTGFAAGFWVYKTTNKGSTWVTVSNVSVVYSIAFTNATTGYYSGTSGVIGKTTNGGNNWFSQSSGTGNTLNSIFFINQTTGFIAGDGGKILYTNDQPLPVGMSNFDFTVQENNVKLSWGTEWELNNKGFDVERKSTVTGNVSEWERTAFIPGNGTVNEPREYQFTDEKLESSSYSYRLKQIDYNGNFEYHYLHSDVTINAPDHFFVSQNYPNPSNPKSKFDVRIPQDGNFKLQVYDLLGKELITKSELKPAGYYTVEIDGSTLSSGIYFYKVSVENSSRNYSLIKKMVLVK